MKKENLNNNKVYTEEQFEKDFKIELFFYNLPQLLLVFACVFIIAYIFNKYIEAITFLFSFFTLRYKFNTTFHYENVFYCIVTTILLFTLSIIFSPPITISLFGSVLFAFLDTWALWFIEDRFEYKESMKYYKVQAEELQKEIQDIANKKDLKQELIDKCEKAKLNDRDTKLAIMYYYERKTPKDIWLWYCQQKEYEYIEWNTIYQILWRIGKKIK